MEAKEKRKGITHGVKVRGNGTKKRRQQLVEIEDVDNKRAANAVLAKKGRR